MREDNTQGDRQYQIGEDFRNFLDQQNVQDPNAPNQGNPPVNLDIPQGGIDPDADRKEQEKNNTFSPREGQGPSAGAASGVNPDFPKFNQPAPATQPAQPQTLTPPSPEAHMGGEDQTHQTPPTPMSPTPVAGAETTPLKAPTPQEMVSNPQQFDMLGTGSLLGSAGGLLGGGLGTPGQLGGVDKSNNNILPLLLQLLSQNQG